MNQPKQFAPCRRARLLPYRVKKFYDELTVCLSGIECPSEVEWFKAFFIAANIARGRKFSGRITPVIFYDGHNYTNFQKQFGMSALKVFEAHNRLGSSFAYERWLSIIRYPLIMFGSYMEHYIKAGKNYSEETPLNYVLRFLKVDYTIREIPGRAQTYAVVRFENLKLSQRKRWLRSATFCACRGLIHCYNAQSMASRVSRSMAIPDSRLAQFIIVMRNMSVA